jgi:hypothetical protein
MRIEMIWGATRLSVEEYLGCHLAPVLGAHGLTDAQIAPVLDDVACRLYAVLRRWNDVCWRRTVLFLGREEATFYEPADADLDIRSLVVVAIRNSLIEHLASTAEAARSLGVDDQVIPDRDIPRLTGAAIAFFRHVDFASVAADRDASPRFNPFADLPRKYPTAWQALAALAALGDTEWSYSPVVAKPPLVAIGVSLPQSWHPALRRDQVISGMERSIEPALQRVLRLIKNGVVPALFADSFKMITRDPAKLLEVIEFVLCHDRPVVTHNYFLSNGYVARRQPLLRPAHTAPEAREKFHDRSGLVERHDRALREIASFL